ncbi:Alpha-galactosidase [Clavibacter michiganensis subsp. michiganensis]|uniref:Alpha-galactosidase n=1 Tax=Clavibacter michiganensis subsp. michiganensis TaxID=33013 RepID=A0A251XLY1_CLAMM|nr:Alpha-galactosidase [Clavibacter michiganensis subsp. michiganensis]OUE04494.1 Alpha-galactosidase [Clavibacter michiganensis subsp. michiganensis]
MPDSVLGELIRATTAPNAANGVDVPPRVALPPEAWTGWTGTPGSGAPHGRSVVSPVRAHGLVGGAARAGRWGLSVSAVDLITDLRLGLILELLPTGLLRARASVTSLSGEPYVLDGLDLAFPGPARAEEILDLAGRWAKERLPQRASFDVGARVREGRHGHRTRAVPAGSAILLR